jgi:hypothetical protein
MYNLEFEEIDELKLVEGDVLWKYMDLHKFLSLLTNKNLFFTRLDKFEDPFEGVNTKLIRRLHILEIMLKSDNPIPGIPTIKIVKEIRKIQKKIKEEQQQQFVNSWVHFNRESIAMWKIYSNKDSIAIKVEGRKFIDFLKNCIKFQPQSLVEMKLICSHVKYQKLNPYSFEEEISNYGYPIALNKDISFDFEKEYRFFIIRNSGNKIPFYKFKISTEFYDLIQVICHPEMEDWKFENVVEICNHYKLKVPRKSEIKINK